VRSNVPLSIAQTEAREEPLRRLGYRDYATYLRSSHWAETRAAYWRDPDTLKVCEVCRTDGWPRTLPLHHRTYERVGAERFDDLTPLCTECHVMVHTLEARGDLHGLDADLATLADPERAREYREANAERTCEQDKAREAIETRRAAPKASNEERIIRRRLARARKKGKRTGLLEAQLERAERRRKAGRIPGLPPSPR